MDRPARLTDSWATLFAVVTLEPVVPVSEPAATGVDLPWQVVTYSRTPPTVQAPAEAPTPDPESPSTAEPSPRTGLATALRAVTRAGRRRRNQIPMGLTTFAGTLLIMFGGLVALKAEDGALWNRLHGAQAPESAPEQPVTAPFTTPTTAASPIAQGHVSSTPHAAPAPTTSTRASAAASLPAPSPFVSGNGVAEPGAVPAEGVPAGAITTPPSDANGVVASPAATTGAEPRSSSAPSSDASRSSSGTAVEGVSATESSKSSKAPSESSKAPSQSSKSPSDSSSRTSSETTRTTQNTGGGSSSNTRQQPSEQTRPRG